MAQHTPGKWFAANHREVRTDADTEMVSQKYKMPMRVCHVDYRMKQGADGEEIYDYDEQSANAILIAAAPELLEACKAFVAKVDRGEARSSESYQQMKSAIEKAEGK